MNPNNVPPQGKPKELTEEAQNKEFTIKFIRRELNLIFNLIVQYPVNMPYGQLRNKQTDSVMETMKSILDKIEGPVVALSNQDFKEDEKAPAINEVQPKKEIAVN